MKIKLICATVNPYTGEQFPSRKEIESFANRLLNDYCKTYDKTLETIDYDEFVSKYIGVDVQYQRLSKDKSILGATIQKDGYIETLNEDGTIKIVNTQRGDIFIDSEACDSDKRELFTIFHELKHYLLDLDKDFKVDKIIDDKTIIEGHFSPNTKSQYSWAEYFANYFAACIVLPRRRLNKLYNKKHAKYFGSFHTRICERRIGFLKTIIKEISEETGVSQSAISIRLKETNLISKGNFDLLKFKFGKEAVMLFRYNKSGGDKK